MILELITVGVIVGQFIYHRWFEEKPDLYKRPDSIGLPTTREGEAVPLVYGRVRVEKPILIRAGQTYEADQVSWGMNLYTGGTGMTYCADLLLVVGIPFRYGTNRLHKMWGGETLFNEEVVSLFPVVTNTLSSLVGDGGHEEPRFVFSSGGVVGAGLVEWLNGNEAQKLIDPDTDTATTFTGDRMLNPGPSLDGDNPNICPGYRGYMMVSLFNGYPWAPLVADYSDPSPEPGSPAGTGGIYLPWWFGDGKTSAPPYSFEVSSYAPITFTTPTVGLEANPADVLYDLVTAKMGKAGRPYTLIDTGIGSSWRLAAEQMLAEGMGYSRVIDSRRSVQDIFHEVLRQIDGVCYEDPSDGKWYLKLIRADYDPHNLFSIGPSNCERLERVAAGGWTGTTNKVRVLFNDRAKFYREGSATAFNQANAVGQDGIVREDIIHMPGVCTQELADFIADRELAARSRPISKFTATVSRSLWPLCKPGTALYLSWPKYNVASMVVRVANANHGPHNSNTIKLDLIQDFFFTYRKKFLQHTGGQTAGTGGLPAFALAE